MTNDAAPRQRAGREALVIESPRPAARCRVGGAALAAIPGRSGGAPVSLRCSVVGAMRTTAPPPRLHDARGRAIAIEPTGMGEFACAADAADPTDFCGVRKRAPLRYASAFTVTSASAVVAPGCKR